MVFWESVSIRAGHITPVMLSVWFLYPSLKIQYSPLVPTNIHPCTQPWIVIRSQRHPQSLCLRSLPTPGPWIAMDQIVCWYIFSRSRRRRWWPFSPVVAGTHESAQRPASHPRTDETKPKPIGQTKIGFSDFHHSTKHIESINICSEGKKVCSNVVQWKTFMSSGKDENKPVQNHCKYTLRGHQWIKNNDFCFKISCPQIVL